MTVIVNTPQELITVSKYAGIDIKLSEISVSFPYHFRLPNRTAESEQEVQDAINDEFINGPNARQETITLNDFITRIAKP
jgi:hypothetical protein